MSVSSLALEPTSLLSSLPPKPQTFQNLVDPFGDWLDSRKNNKLQQEHCLGPIQEPRPFCCALLQPIRSGSQLSCMGVPAVPAGQVLSFQLHVEPWSSGTVSTGSWCLAAVEVRRLS